MATTAARSPRRRLDEYEEAPSNSGIWSLDPSDGDLILLDHSPSGDFTPIVDSYGRVIFTRWDHLQRDQQADADAPSGTGYGTYGTFNYSDESASALRLNSRAESFPEPRASRTDLLAGTNLAGHSFNHFFPWQVNQDGTELETLNHIGRHELHDYFNLSLTDDSALDEFIDDTSGRHNTRPLVNFLQIKEDPLNPGLYYGVDAPEFYTHASGQVVAMTGAPTLDAESMDVRYVTHRDTSNIDDTPSASHSGFYRDPLPLSTGEIVVAHATTTRQDANTGTRANPGSRYNFRLKTLVSSGAYSVTGTLLTSGISKNIQYYDPDVLVSYNGPLWELNPVEVRARQRPPDRTPTLEQPELAQFTAAGITPAQVRDFLVERNLALVVSRNVTTRDAADQQQPYNLRIAGSLTQTIGDQSGKVYDVSSMQFYQGDQLRGIGGYTSLSEGRRVLAVPMHSTPNITPQGAPPGSVALGEDGSMAALVPARRALSWQLLSPGGVPVVRERYWLSFQPGEMRLCASCHGLNQQDQQGATKPDNSPEALGELLAYIKQLRDLTPSVYLPMMRR